MSQNEPESIGSDEEEEYEEEEDSQEEEAFSVLDEEEEEDNEKENSYVGRDSSRVSSVSPQPILAPNLRMSRPSFQPQRIDSVQYLPRAQIGQRLSAPIDEESPEQSSSFPVIISQSSSMASMSGKSSMNSFRAGGDSGFLKQTCENQLLQEALLKARKSEYSLQKEFQSLLKEKQVVDSVLKELREEKDEFQEFKKRSNAFRLEHQIEESSLKVQIEKQKFMIVQLQRENQKLKTKMKSISGKFQEAKGTTSSPVLGKTNDKMYMMELEECLKSALGDENNEKNAKEEQKSTEEKLVEDASKGKREEIVGFLLREIKGLRNQKEDLSSHQAKETRAYLRDAHTRVSRLENENRLLEARLKSVSEKFERLAAKDEELKLETENRISIENENKRLWETIKEMRMDSNTKGELIQKQKEAIAAMEQHLRQIIEPPLEASGGLEKLLEGISRRLKAEEEEKRANTDETQDNKGIERNQFEEQREPSRSNEAQRTQEPKESQQKETGMSMEEEGPTPLMVNSKDVKVDMKANEQHPKNTEMMIESATPKFEDKGIQVTFLTPNTTPTAVDLSMFQPISRTSGLISRLEEERATAAHSPPVETNDFGSQKRMVIFKKIDNSTQTDLKPEKEAQTEELTSPELTEATSQVPEGTDPLIN